MSQDLLKYARQTNVRLFLGFLLILFIVGDGLIYIYYGIGGALMGLLCLMAGLLPLILIAAALQIIELLARRGQDG